MRTIQEQNNNEVASCLPPAPYLGGKSKLAKQLIEIINATPHTGYAEVFCGMGGVFFRRDRRPKTEVINDISKDVSNLFRILQRHYPQFIETLKFQLSSRADFDRLKNANADSLTDLERAARFLYLQKTSFGGMGGTYGVDKSGGSRFNLSRVEAILADVHERLQFVTIECLGWQNFIKRYDRDGMLFYLDPPYWDNENDYGKGIFSKQDFYDIALALENIKGKFVFSINDTPEIRDIFSAFDMQEVSLNYTVSRGAQTKAKELIITG